MSRSPAQAETAQDSDRKESKARSRDLASISAPRMRFPPRANGRPSFWERPSYALPDRRRKASRGDAIRPRPVGGVNWLVKTLTLTREITGGMLRAARARRPLD